MMLELRPTCEHCNKPLPPDSPEARICSYECTFCAACVENVLHDVCPNCGGGFVPRPIRPAQAWRPGLSLTDRPASTERHASPYPSDEIAAFSARLQGVPPEKR